MPLIIPSNSISGVGYEVDNSLRFDDGSSDNLSRTPSSASNRKTFTFSTWVKYSQANEGSALISAGTDISNGPLFIIDFITGKKLRIEDTISGDNVIALRTTQIFRDPSAWYHVVVAIDTTQSTSSDRVKLYINGSQVTSFSTETYPSQDTQLAINNTHIHRIGTRATSPSGKYLDGYLCETVLIDGQQLDPTSFGEFDDSGIWKPIDVSGLTFGTNGFYLDFENSGSLGADVSGNGNNFTVNNLTSIDQTTDTPTNNFCTIVNASSASKTYTLSEGNLKVTASTSNWYGVPRGSIGVSSGKWYYEVKVTSENDNFMAGYMSATNLADIGDRQVNGFEKLNGFQSSGYIKRQDNTDVNISGSFQWNSGDIAQIALDMDNKKLWIGKNGSYYNSGNPATGSNETIGSSYFTSGEAYLPALVFYGTNDGSFNFGNPPYTISSGNSDADGYGNFEYSVPSGYYALNTKNLAEYG